MAALLLGILLTAGGAPLLVAALAAAAAAVFASWRTIAGVVAAATLATGAALVALTYATVVPLPSRSFVLLALLEVFGAITVVVSGALSVPPRVNRRLLGSWLSTSALLGLGLGLASSPPTVSLGAALVAGAFTWRIGAVPAFAWAPLLIRHFHPRVAGLGFVALPLTIVVFLDTVSAMAREPLAVHVVMVLAAGALPWSLWHLVREWRKGDRRCARSYVIVAIQAMAILALRR